MKRGLEQPLARQVATKLTAADPLGAHLRDELGITHSVLARPWQAATVSAFSFVVGAAFPMIALLVAPSGARIPVIAGVALAVLAITGGLGGRLGGAPVSRAAARVLVGGGVAMALTALIGNLVGNVV